MVWKRRVGRSLEAYSNVRPRGMVTSSEALAKEEQNPAYRPALKSFHFLQKT